MLDIQMIDGEIGLMRCFNYTPGAFIMNGLHHIPQAGMQNSIKI